MKHSGFAGGDTNSRRNTRCKASSWYWERQVGLLEKWRSRATPKSTSAVTPFFKDCTETGQSHSGRRFDGRPTQGRISVLIVPDAHPSNMPFSEWRVTRTRSSFGGIT